MTFDDACEYIKSRNLWDEFLSWFSEWFEVGLVENEKWILAHTTILYADGLMDLEQKIFSLYLI